MDTVILRIEKYIKNKNESLDLSMKLKSLPVLPNFIKILYCNNNKLIELPDKMPNSLQKIYCSNNQITKLPDKIPDSLQQICCKFNKIIKLPGKMPDSLQKIYCNNNQITKLPNKMPASLQKIDCSANQIIELPLLLRINKCEFDCDSNDKFYVAAKNLLKRNIIKNKYKKIFNRLVICNKLFNLGFNDCSFIISQYI